MAPSTHELEPPTIPGRFRFEACGKECNQMTMKIQKYTIAIALSISLTACVPGNEPKPQTSPQDLFFERISLLCDKAYEGKLVSDEEVDADFRGKAMVMHVARCNPDKVEIPFHVAGENDQWNRSRTWIITRTKEGIRLKHRHRHEDGSLDTVTNYGGDTDDEGSAERQEFPVDGESITLFQANELEGSITNIWAVDITAPGQNDAKFAYELRRPDGPNKRFFRVEFDLSKVVDAPPPAWGD